MENSLQLGIEPGCTLEISEAYYVNILSKKTTESFISHVSKILQDTDTVNISLSGGIDSQFSLLLCRQLNKKINLYTYRSFWKDTILNAEDVYIAEQISDRENIRLNVVDIELSKFYNEKLHFTYGDKFFNDSPQLAVHFYWLEILKKKFNIENILLGGDPPLFKYADINESNKNLRTSNENFFQDILAPYYFVCRHLGIECYRDIFYHSPELVYLSYKNNIDVVKKERIFIDSLPSRKSGIDGEISAPFKIDNYIFKKQWYSNLIDGFITQKSETSGFENLKKILASESGIYNQYDILYRKPMVEQSTNTVKYYQSIRKNRNTKLNRSRNIIYDKGIKDLYNEFLNAVKTSKAKPINRYKFDF